MPENQIRLAVSHSAVADYRRCEQLYFYKYVERLRPRDRAVAPEMGTILHDYMNEYYEGLKNGEKAEDAHTMAQMSISAKYMPQLRRLARAAREVGSGELSHALLGVNAAVGRITDRYFAVRGRDDAERYRVLLVEEFFTVPVAPGIVSNGRVDLVTQELDRGIVDLWEHKSTKSVPDMEVRLRDTQTPLYARRLRDLGKIPEVDSVMWNYIRTVEPVEPHVLKNGELSVAISTDTTWPVYLEAILRNGLDPDSYQDMRRKLEGRELSAFFPRHHQPIVSEVDILFRDHATTAKEIQRSRKAWAAGIREPVRTLDRSCDYCEMEALCNAAILAGDDSDIKTMRYIVGT